MKYENKETIEPVKTSDGQWHPRYILDIPTSVANKNKTKFIDGNTEDNTRAIENAEHV